MPQQAWVLGDLSAVVMAKELRSQLPGHPIHTRRFLLPQLVDFKPAVSFPATPQPRRTQVGAKSNTARTVATALQSKPPGPQNYAARSC